VADYTGLGIMDWQGTKAYRNLMKIEEPYQYRDRLTMPKFIINATGDQFFLPDSSQFYFKDLLGTKYLRYVPNADHSLKESDAFETLIACYNAVLTKAALPRFTWKTGEDAIRVRATDAPTTVKVWQATNPNARDFRLMTIGKAWTSSDLTPEGEGKYVAHLEKPEKGWRAYVVELTYDRKDSPTPFKFTTDVKVVPDVLPFKFVPKHRN
jgi:PhoPQ-activated pathogenicity-related protein